MNKTFKLAGEIEINRLAYGAMQLTGSGVFGEVADRPNAIGLLKTAVAESVNFIDTADAYGPHLNETLIAEALHPYKKGLIIATKGGFERPGPNQWRANGSPEHIRQAIEGSLKRLKVETIDLWQLHRIDPKVPVAESLKPVADAMKVGKIRHVGLSEVNVDQIKQVQKILPVVSVQNLYNLADRKWEDVLDYCSAQGLAFIPWFPLSSGPQNFSGAIQEIAGARGVSEAQIALAWLLKRADNILLIPGTKTIAHLKDNLAAGAIDLSAEEFKALS